MVPRGSRSKSPVCRVMNEQYDTKRSNGLRTNANFRVTAHRVRAEVGRDLAQAEVAVAERRQFRPRELPVDEQADLFDVVRSHVLAQGLAHGMGAGLGDRHEDVAMRVGNDHAAAESVSPMIRQAIRRMEQLLGRGRAWWPACAWPLPSTRTSAPMRSAPGAASRWRWPGVLVAAAGDPARFRVAVGLGAGVLVRAGADAPGVEPVPQRAPAAAQGAAQGAGPLRDLPADRRNVHAVHPGRCAAGRAGRCSPRSGRWPPSAWCSNCSAPGASGCSPPWCTWRWAGWCCSRSSRSGPRSMRGRWAGCSRAASRTLGTVFYHRDSPAYSHAIWHLFVIAGGACHFVAICAQVLPRG